MLLILGKGMSFFKSTRTHTLVFLGAPGQRRGVGGSIMLNSCAVVRFFSSGSIRTHIRFVWILLGAFRTSLPQRVLTVIKASTGVSNSLLCTMQSSSSDDSGGVTGPVPNTCSDSILSTWAGEAGGVVILCMVSVIISDNFQYGTWWLEPLMRIGTQLGLIYFLNKGIPNSQSERFRFSLKGYIRMTLFQLSKF